MSLSAAAAEMRSGLFGVAMLHTSGGETVMMRVTRLVAVAIVAVALAGACGCRSGPAPNPASPAKTDTGGKAEVSQDADAAKDTGDEVEPTPQPSADTDGESQAGNEGEAETEQVVKLRVGETFDLALPENLTTAYSWKCTWEPEGLLQLTKTEYIPDQPAATGSGGTRHYHFAAAQAGQATVTLILSADESGKEKNVAEQKTVEVEISPY